MTRTFRAIGFMCACVCLMYSPSINAQIVHLHDIGGDYEWLNYKVVDGAQLYMLVFKPVDHKSTDRSPAIVFIHGGGFVGGHPSFFFPHCQYFTSRGMVAFTINYRLITKKGPEGIDAVGSCVADCKSAVRYIRANAEKFGIDSDRIAVAGDSAGGHLAAALGTMKDFENPGEDTKISAMANAMILYNPAVDMNIPAFKNVFTLSEVNDDIRARYARYSPITYVAKGQPPALLMHGIDDTNVPIESAYRFAEAMKKAGNRCDMVALENTKHAFVIVGIGTEATIVNALQVTDRFLASLGYLSCEPTIEMGGRK
ncbi:alpha/beta hydrolase [bacterium]|nr:alpha/beta hydrolase [bacterium]